MLDSTEDYAPIDLLTATRSPQLRSLLMESLSERFMRQIAFALFQRIRQSVQLLSCINGVTSHEVALSQLPEVMLAGICELAPLRGRMLLAIDGDLIGAIVLRAAGALGDGNADRQAGDRSVFGDDCGDAERAGDAGPHAGRL
jgi:flagellar motor switch protein FliM